MVMIEYSLIYQNYKYIKITFIGIEYIGEKEKNRGYIVMEKISGETILNIVLDKGHFTEKDAKILFK